MAIPGNGGGFFYFRKPSTIKIKREVFMKEKSNLNQPASPAIDAMNLAQLRLMHGNNFGTSGYGIINVPEVTKSNSLVILTWQNNCQKEDMNPKELLSEGIDLIKECYADFNSFKHLFGRYDAEWAIHLGKNLIQMKSLAKKAGFMWEAWAAENLKFIGKRNRSNFMNLARRKDCHPYSFLGVDRLSILCSATADFKDDNDDLIGAFMAKHKIVFDPTKEFDLDEFKVQIDTALNMEKLQKHGVDLDAEKVKILTESGKKFEKSFILRFKDIKESGGDINAYAEKVAVSSGDDSLEDEGKTRLQDFSTLSNRLIATIDYIVKENSDEIEKIDSDTFLRLHRKLEVLRKLGNFNEQIEKAA